MTQEEKVRAYDEAVKKVKDYYEGKTKMYSDIKQTLDLLFPELKESDDEVTRKSLILYLEYKRKEQEEAKYYQGVEGFERWIAWLEKQGVQKPVDKVEPKFKVDDWIVEPRENEPNGLWHIESIENRYYWANGCGCRIEFADKNYHLWTIEDAKDGDVLFHSDTASNGIFIFKEVRDGKVLCHCDFDSEDHFRLGEYHNCCWVDDNIKPAIKEQHDILFEKMREAGYEWDAEKKELKKIEQKPKWTEEDERIMNFCISRIKDELESLKNNKFAHQEILQDYKEGCWERIDWLKFIKKRMKEQQ